MARFSFGSTTPRGWLTLAASFVVTFAAPAAHGQGRSFHPRPFTTSFTTPSIMRSTTPSMTATTPFTQTNAILRRDLRFDSPFHRDLRFDRLLGLEFGFGRFAGTPFGTTPFWGTWGGGFLGSGISVIPVGVGGGITTPVAPKSSGDTPDPARAALLSEQVIAERLANRRRAFDELQYERDKTPTPEQELLSRSRGNPSPAEVRSGQAVNALLTDLRQVGVDELNRSDAMLPLDRRGLRHINVSRGPGNIALLKDEGRLTWPAALAGAAFQGARQRLTAQALEAVRQAGSFGRVDSGIVRQMTDDLSQLRQLLRQNAKELPFQPYAEARDFLQRFDDAVVALGQPDAADYFNGTYDLKAQTVLGLVTQMTDKGLRFAPAVPGDETAYAALREALAACDRAAAKSQSAMR
jgi:hypothetical protein